MKYSLGISNFIEEIASLSHSIVFLYFFALITEEGFLISPCYSLELYIQMGILFLFSFALSFSFSHLFALFVQMFKLDLEKAEEPEIKLPTSAGSSKKQEFQKNIYFCFIDQSLWLCGSQQTVENS